MVKQLAEQMHMSENNSSCVKQTISGPPKEICTALGRTVGSVILNGPSIFWDSGAHGTILLRRPSFGRDSSSCAALSLPASAQRAGILRLQPGKLFSIHN